MMIPPLWLYHRSVNRAQHTFTGTNQVITKIKTTPWNKMTELCWLLWNANLIISHERMKSGITMRLQTQIFLHKHTKMKRTYHFICFLQQLEALVLDGNPGNFLEELWKDLFSQDWRYFPEQILLCWCLPHSRRWGESSLYWMPILLFLLLKQDQPNYSYKKATTVEITFP